MDRKKLQQALQSAGVRPNAHDLWGQQIDETYGLRCDVDGWRVVYRERGVDRDLFSPGDENEACNWILAKILSDPTSTQAPGGGLQ